jgi:hypothetical protein
MTIAIATAGDAVTMAMGGSSAIALPGVLFDDNSGGDVALDETALASGGLAQRHRGQAVESVIDTPPFLAPHHTISTAALIGGGSSPRPGEISLATTACIALSGS